MKADNYYSRELSGLTRNEYPNKVIFHGANESTRMMDLNKESARAIIDYLTENYLGGKK